jgi:hypothetical protein
MARARMEKRSERIHSGTEVWIRKYWIVPGWAETIEGHIKGIPVSSSVCAI